MEVPIRTLFYLSESQLERINYSFPVLTNFSGRMLLMSTARTKSCTTVLSGGVKSEFSTKFSTCWQIKRLLMAHWCSTPPPPDSPHSGESIQKGIIHVSSVEQKEAWIPNLMPFVPGMGGPSCFCWLKDRSAATKVHPFSSAFFPIPARLGRRRLWRELAAGISENQGDDSLHTTPKDQKESIFLIRRCTRGGILLKTHSAGWRTGGVSWLGMTAVPLPFSQSYAYITVIFYLN